MSQLFRKSAIEKLSSPDQLDRSVIITSPMSWIALVGAAAIICCVILWAFFGTLPESLSVNGIISTGVETNSVYSHISGTVDTVNVKIGDSVDKDSVICTLTDSIGKKHDVISGQKGVVSSHIFNAGDKVNQGDAIAGISPAEYASNVLVCYIPYSRIQKIHVDMPVKIIPDGIDSQKYGHMEGRIINIDTYATAFENIQKVLGSDTDLINYIISSDEPVCAVTCSIKPDSGSANGFYWSNPKGKELAILPRAVAEVKIITNEQPPISRLIPGYGMEE